MPTKDLLQVHPILIDRVRLAVMATLAAAAEPLDFHTLVESLELTNGNLSAHMRKPEEAKFVQVAKEFVDRKPRTTYRCTKSGRKEIQNYLHVVESLLKKGM